MGIKVNEKAPERCDDLKRKEKKFIILAILLTIVFCGGLYVNHQLDRLVTALSSTGLLFVYPEGGSIILPPGGPDGAAGIETLPPDAKPPDVPPPGKNGSAGVPGAVTPAQDNNAESSGNDSGKSGSGSAATNDGNAAGGSQLERDIVAAVQQKLGQPLDKKDLIKAGLVILRKLNTEEISYLYSVGSRNSYTRDEYQRVREILLTKLSAQDLQTLREIGAQYGKQLRILEPDRGSGS